MSQVLRNRTHRGHGELRSGPQAHLRRFRGTVQTLRGLPRTAEVGFEGLAMMLLILPVYAVFVGRVPRAELLFQLAKIPLLNDRCVNPPIRRINTFRHMPAER